MRKIVFISAFLFLTCKGIFALERASYTPSAQEDTHIKDTGKRQKSPDKAEDKTIKDDTQPLPQEAQKNTGGRQKSKAADKETKDNTKNVTAGQGSGERQRSSD